MATLARTGRLGDCAFKTSAGDINIARAGAVQLKTSVGDITVDRRRRRRGHDELRRGSDRATSTEPAAVRNSNGDTWIGDVAATSG